MVELGRLCAQAQLDIPKALPVRELRKRHDAKLLGAGEVFDVVVGAPTSNDSVKALPRQEVHDLCEEGLAEVHALLRE